MSASRNGDDAKRSALANQDLCRGRSSSHHPLSPLRDGASSIDRRALERRRHELEFSVGSGGRLDELHVHLHDHVRHRFEHVFGTWVFEHLDE